MQKKILVLVSNPKGTANLNVLPEIRDLQEALQRSLNRERFTVEWRVAKLQTDLRRTILDVKPHIIHFCGHGTDQGLVLEDDTGKAKVVSNEFLTDLLRVFADRIECVLLNACDSENLADQLGQHLNYVIGMNQEVRDDAAIAFAEGFYDTLGAGESYERAFEVGKNAVLGKATLRHAPDTPGRKATVVGEAGEPVKGQNREHLIPVLKINPNPTPIKPLWLAPEVERAAVRELLAAIESGFNTIKLFHTDEAIVLKDQYIPVQVTLERRYQHSVETIGGYAESEAELRRIYAMKGSSEEEIQEEIKRQQVDWEEARRQHSRIVVLADPGMGKSTLLRREVVTGVQDGYKALAEGKPLKEITIPLFIRLSTLAHKVMKMPMLEAILESIQEDELCYKLLRDHKDTEVMNFLNAFLKEQLLDGKGLLLLDALDEVPDGNCQKLLEKLNGFAKAYPTCLIVGTSRIVGYGGRFVDGAKDVEIVPFTQKQTEQYIETWFTNAQKSLKNQSISARGLVKALRERPQLAGLAQNPLLLSLICSLYQRDQLTLPARRSQIYEQAVNCMLGEWNRTRPDFDDARTTAKIRLLEELAYYFTCEGQEVFDYEDLYDWVESYLEGGDAPRDLRGDKTGELIAELTEDDGILQKLYRDKNDDQYLFLHRTFQEYFTASYLKRSLKKNKKNPAYVTELVRKYCWNYDWHETLTLLAGLMDNPMVLIEAIAAEKDDIFQTQLLLAGRCVTECEPEDASIVEVIIDRIFSFWETYLDLEFIQSIVIMIGYTKPYMFNKLIQTLHHPKLNKPPKNVEEPEASEIVFDLRFDPGPEAVLQALSILGKIGNTSAVSDIQFARSYEGRHVWRYAADALEAIGSQEALHALLFMYNGDKYVRKRRQNAWRKISTEHLLSVIRNREIDPSTRMEGTWILGDRREPEALSVLTEILNDETENCQVRGQAAVGLGRLGDERGLDALVEALRNKEEEIAKNAAWALGKVGSTNGVQALVVALHDDRENVVQKAAEALGQIGDVSAVDGLIKVLAEPQHPAHQTAIAALAKIGSPQAIEPLAQLLAHSELRWSVISALGQIGTDQSVEILADTFNQEECEDHYHIASELVHIGTSQALEVLLFALAGEHQELRESAASVLADLDNPEIIQALSCYDEDENKEVRKWAVKALLQLDEYRGYKALTSALYDPDLQVWAGEHLAECSHPEVIEDLIETALVQFSESL